MRQSQSAPLVTDLEQWLRSERTLLSKHAKVAKAIDYLLSPNHWPAFTRFLEDGRVCLTNNAAERSLRGVALGRKSWALRRSERGGQRAAAIYTLIGTAKLNDIDPQAWLADVIARISDTPVPRLHELLPWNWKPADPNQGLRQGPHSRGTRRMLTELLAVRMNDFPTGRFPACVSWARGGGERVLPLWERDARRHSRVGWRSARSSRSRDVPEP